ncbi:CoA transferase subunit A [Microbulbifer pacificus]|uniref:CoA-transferase n=1 Tax=Microbulbifer pacificus TaxID=407164 RepID=A0AAU0N375_9GAMM|nr:CoA-transferase [Microbulbifer pacificus]WOX07225.1 CoA-transferase [Microbulbifer pacificus]
MATFVSLSTAIAELVRDGQQLALEGFTHLIPFAAGHEIIRQGRRDLHLVRMTPDLIYDQLIGMGCASKLTFSWGGNPGVGSLHRLRDAVENAWPRPLDLCEYSHAELAAAYSAGAAGLPSGLLQGFRDTDLYTANPDATRAVACPFSGTALTAVPAIRPDVTILHAQCADRAGNVLLRGITGAAREAALAARALLVTVEEQVESLDAGMNAIVLPSFLIDAIAVVPGGAYPSYTQGYYPRDNSFYQAWDGIARERESFLSWMNRHVLDSPDHSALLHKLGVAA